MREGHIAELEGWTRQDMLKLVHVLMRYETLLEETVERLQAQVQESPVASLTWRRTPEDFVVVDLTLAARKYLGSAASHRIGVNGSEIYGRRSPVLSRMTECFLKKTNFKAEDWAGHFKKPEDTLWTCTPN